MKRRRVKITGIGPVTPAGIGREAFWKGILEPVSRVRPYTGLGDNYGPVVAAYVDNFEIKDHLERSVQTGTARHTLFAIAGSVLALQDAKISTAEFRDANCAVVTGSGYMDFGGIGVSVDAVQKAGFSAAHRRAPYTVDIGGVPSAVSQALEVAARTMALSSQCVSGIDAIGYAADLVASGGADIVLCGGTDAPLHRFPLLELRAAGLTPLSHEMPDRIARPFDRWRTTGVISEGACMFVLEPETSRRAGYSWISGYAYANDTPNDLCSGITFASRRALADARMGMGELDSINAWGPGHKAVDAGEARALTSLLGDLLPEIPVVSIKGAVGSPVGAAPAIQVATAALALRFGILPPTVNWEYPDPACCLNLSSKPRVVSHRTTLVNAHGISGLNGSMILERC